MARTIVTLAITVCLLLPALAQERKDSQEHKDPRPTFGTTVFMPTGLMGQVYKISEFSTDLPRFKHGKPIATVYTDSLNITPREFKEGFPGVTDRVEYFAIDYKGRFWIERPGPYRFRLTSDDGSKLYIDNKAIVDNDGIHAPLAKTGICELSRGIHSIRVSYFQGPRYTLALILEVSGPDATDEYRIFNTYEFRPPPGFDAGPPPAEPSDK